MKKERGITLIALIITIIIMLILVGVTISITLGENGIIQKSKEARDSQTAAQNKEISELGGAGVESKIDALVSGSGTQTISTKVTALSQEKIYVYNTNSSEEDWINQIIVCVNESENTAQLYMTDVSEDKYICSLNLDIYYQLTNPNNTVPVSIFENLDIDISSVKIYGFGSAGIFCIDDDWYIPSSTFTLVKLDYQESYDLSAYSNAHALEQMIDPDDFPFGT